MNKVLDAPENLDMAIEDVTCDACETNKATHRILTHGCGFDLGCTPCVDVFLLRLKHYMASGGLTCKKCEKVFRTPEAWARVIPL